MPWTFFDKNGNQKQAADPASLVGQEVGYAEITSAPAAPTHSTEATSDVIITAPAVTFDGVSAYLIEFWAMYASGGSGSASFALWDNTGGVSLGRVAAIDANQSRSPFFVRRKLTPAAGSRTYSIRWWIPSGGVPSLYAGAGGAGNDMPAHIRITKAS